MFLALRPEQPLDDDTVDALGAALRPGDDELRIWREEGRGLLRVATEGAAPDLETALGLAQALGTEVLGAVPGPAAGGLGHGGRGLSGLARGSLRPGRQPAVRAGRDPGAAAACP